MAAQPENEKPCRQSYPTRLRTEANRAQMSQPAHHPAERTTPERPYDNEAQAPTHDALSVIYNRGY